MSKVDVDKAMNELITEVKKLGKQEGLLAFRKSNNPKSREDIVAIANLEYDIRSQTDIVRVYRNIYDMKLQIKHLNENKKFI